MDNKAELLSLSVRRFKDTGHEWIVAKAELGLK